ncbi:MAG: pyruvate kinase [Saprospiraceae bacterium]|jgi:pyruvate kinase
MKQLERDLTKLYHSLLNKEFIARKAGDDADPLYRLSAINLVRYITLRNQDLRNVHDHLSDLGISSLRSCEGYVMQNVVSVLRLVKLLNGEIWANEVKVETIGYKASKKLIAKHTKQLFNLKRKNRTTKIMVTIPLEAAFDNDLVRELLAQGMEIARINLKEGSRQEWELIINKIQNQAKDLKCKCLIYMDIIGPEFKTGNIEITASGKNRKRFIRLRKGEHIIITADETLAKDNKKDNKGIQLETPIISVSRPSIIQDAKVGDRIFFDNDKIECRVLKKGKDDLELIVISHSTKGLKLKSNKAIYLPDTEVTEKPITKSDIANFPFIMQHADIVGFSYLKSAADVEILYKEMDSYDRNDLGVILKIRSKESFENLPMILLEAMKKPRIGIMIDREDLSVEVGAERIAEIQDQIMWICEAAHVPVIWASQVLEKMVQTGKATKAEITDAAKSARAECVMLNKGPFVTETVATLSNILQKMEGHTSKKKSVMRALKVSQKNMDRLGMNISTHL